MLNELEAIPPASFFRLFIKIRAERSRLAYLPDVSGLSGEDMFARIALIWSLKGIHVQVDIKVHLTQSFFPNYRKGDSLELFFNTRQLNHTQSVHQFCHHFVFLPEEVNGAQSIEVTRFRFSEEHSLAQPDLFQLETKVKRGGYAMSIHIPKENLHGYDPSEFKTLGFAYRINRLGGEPQQFPLPSKFFSLDKDPRLWATLIFS